MCNSLPNHAEICWTLEVSSEGERTCKRRFHPDVLIGTIFEHRSVLAGSYQRTRTASFFMNHATIPSSWLVWMERLLNENHVLGFVSSLIAVACLYSIVSSQIAKSTPRIRAFVLCVSFMHCRVSSSASFFLSSGTSVLCLHMVTSSHFLLVLSTLQAASEAAMGAVPQEVRCGFCLLHVRRVYY